MQITGLIMDARTQTPVAAARVVITTEGSGSEIYSSATDTDGRFTFDDDLNEYLGQQLAVTVDHQAYHRHRSVYLAERGLTITVQMTPLAGPPSFWERVRRWLASLTRWQRLALAAIPLVLVVAVLAIRFWPPPAVQLTVEACTLDDIRRGVSSEDQDLLGRIAEICEREGKADLRFSAIEQCAMREMGPCLIIMARWYDPVLEGQATPFTRRNGVAAAEYYRRARNKGVEDARAGLDAVCRLLRQQGGQEAVAAGC